MIRITMTQRSDGTDVATCGTESVASRRGASMALARQLVRNQGVDAWAPVEVVWPDGRVRWTASSLMALARLTVKEAGHTPRIVPYVADARFPASQDAPDGAEAADPPD